MTGTVVGAIIGVGFLMLLNIVLFAYVYGQLKGQVVTLSILVNNHVLSELKGIQKRLDMIADRISHLEGRLGD